MFKGIEHVAIASPAPERLAKWYCDTLDFRIVKQWDGKVFLRAVDGSLLEIIPSAGDRPPGDRRTPGIRHLAIAVDDFDSATSRLGESGVTLLGEPLTDRPSPMLFFEDADGNVLHLIRRTEPLP